MRLWHQSTTDLTKLTKYRENICNHAKQVLDPSVTVEPHGFPPEAYGTRTSYKTLEFMQYPYIKFLHERVVCEAALTAEREGFDVVAIGCNLDIGLKRCRSIVNIPVAGVTESSMHAACLLGEKFAFITISDFMQAHITASVKENGLMSRLACVLTMEAPFDNYAGDGTLQTDGHGPSPISRFLMEDPAKAEEIFLSTCEKAIAMGADVLIPGEGILNEFIYGRKVTQCNGMPILDSNAALWHFGVMLANLRSKSNIITSRGFAYKKPDDELAKQIRDFHQARSFSYADFS